MKTSINFISSKENYNTFKSFVKEEHYGDSAHAIYTAWYLFKHNYSRNDAIEYIKTDFDKTHKHFVNHGCDVVVKLPFASDLIREYFSGAGYISLSRWQSGVLAIYDYFVSLDVEAAKEAELKRIAEKEAKKKAEEAARIEQEKKIEELRTQKLLNDVKAAKDAGKINFNMLYKIFGKK